jgi:hypothetical protein
LHANSPGRSTPSEDNFAAKTFDAPGLEPDDIRACVAYGAEMTRERVVVIGRGAA